MRATGCWVRLGEGEGGGGGEGEGEGAHLGHVPAVGVAAELRQVAGHSARGVLGHQDEGRPGADQHQHETSANHHAVPDNNYSSVMVLGEVLVAKQGHAEQKTGGQHHPSLHTHARSHWSLCTRLRYWPSTPINRPTTDVGLTLMLNTISTASFNPQLGCM